MPTDRALRRAYARAHPVTLWFAIGVALTGAVSLIAPSLTTGTSAVLPEFLQVIFNAAWVLGGGAGALGIMRAKAAIEAAGMTLISAALLAFTALILSVVGFVASAVFVGALAIGTGLRARILSGGL